MLTNPWRKVGCLVCLGVDLAVVGGRDTATKGEEAGDGHECEAAALKFGDNDLEGLDCLVIVLEIVEQDYISVRDAREYGFDPLLGRNVLVPVAEVETIDEAEVREVVHRIIMLDIWRTEEPGGDSDCILDQSGGPLDLITHLCGRKFQHMPVVLGMVLYVTAKRLRTTHHGDGLLIDIAAVHEKGSRDTIGLHHVEGLHRGCSVGAIIEAQGDIFPDTRRIQLAEYRHSV